MCKYYIMLSFGAVIETTQEEFNKLVISLNSNNRDYTIDKQERNESRGILYTNIILKMRV